MSRRINIMECSPFSEERLGKWLSIPPNYALVQAKYKGVRAKWDGIRLMTSEGNPFSSVPHIIEWLRKNNMPNFDGELYVHGMPEEEIRSITSRTVNIHPDHEKIKFHIFDIVNNAEQATRAAVLTTLRTASRNTVPRFIEIVPTFTLSTPQGIHNYLTETVNRGYEGIVLRNPLGRYETKRSVNIMKWKPEYIDEYKIKGYLEGAGKYRDTLGALILFDNKGNTFHVGSFRIDDKERKALWDRREELVGMTAVIAYSGLTKRSVPPSSVFIKIKIK